MRPLGRLGWAVLGLVMVLAWGCAHHPQAVGYGGAARTPADVGVSNPPPPGNPAYGAPPGNQLPPPLQQSAPPPSAPPAAATVDHEVADAIHRLLTQDPHLAPGAGNVTARVYKGRVTLRGTVASSHERDEVVQRVEQLPGVDYVDDQLRLEGPQ